MEHGRQVIVFDHIIVAQKSPVGIGEGDEGELFSAV